MMKIVRKAVENKEGQGPEEKAERFEVKNQITIREMMEGLKKKKWVYMKYLLAFLRHKAPF